MNPVMEMSGGLGPNRKALLEKLGGNTGVTGGAFNNSPIYSPGERAPEPAAPSPVAPAPYAAKGPAMGLEGFDAGKLSSGHVSPKYVFAKHAQGLGAGDTDELLRRLQADESGYFKNASFGGSKGDRLQIGGQLDPAFNGISEFDVIRAMGEGGKGWQWAGAGGPAPAQGGGMAAPQGGVPLNSLLTGDPIAGINAAIGQQGEQSSFLRALLQQLGQ